MISIDFNFLILIFFYVSLGVQGLADVFIMMRMPFESPEARQVNKEIFETVP